MNHFSGTVNPHELVQVRLDSGHDPRDIVSLMLGLNSPESGSILFTGKDWLGTDYTRHFLMRSRIGRVFAGTAWIQSLTVNENIRLAGLHHRHDPTTVGDRIDHWITTLAGNLRASVLRSLKRRPAFVDPPLLQICQLVRAISIEPLMLILERPLRFLPYELHTTLVAAIERLREQGTAVMWLAGDREDLAMSFSGLVSVWNIVHDELMLGEELNRE